MTNAEEIPRLVAHGWRTAVSGAPGPVLLDCPIDVLFSPPIHDRIAWGAITRPLPFAPAPDPTGIAEAVKLWSEAKRPVIITGTGARGADFGQNLTKLAENTQTPVFYSSKFSNGLPANHPLRGGPAVRLALLPSIGEEQPDFILLLGARTGFLLGGRGGAVLPSDKCRFVQVDLDGSEIGKSHAVDVGIVSTTASAVKAFLQSFERSPYRASEGWVKTANSLKSVPCEFDKQPKELDAGKLHPYHAMRALYQSLEPGAIVCIDGGEAGGWALQLVELARSSLTMVSTGYLGFLGNGWGYALGAAVADPSRQIVNMQGDGSAGFHLAELDTYARHKLNILTVITNNSVWGMSQAGQELIYGEKNPQRPASKLNPAAEYETVAAGLQCASARVDNIEDIAGAVQKLSKAGRPALLNMVVSDKPIHSDTKSMVNNTESQDWIVVPYYDNVPRPYYKT